MMYLANLSQCSLGQKALMGYLGDNKTSWLQYDATHLVKSYKGPLLNILIDQGTDDSFYNSNVLLTDNFVQAANDQPYVHVDYHLRDGYDHGYWFIQTFIDNHLEFHARYLK